MTGVDLLYEQTPSTALNLLSENKEKNPASNFVIVEEDGSLHGVICLREIFDSTHKEDELLGKLSQISPAILHEDETLKAAVDKMLLNNLETLPIVSRTKANQLAGILSYRDILEAYKLRDKEAGEEIAISLRKQTIRVIIKGRRFLKK